MLTTAALAPSVAMNGPLMLAPPSYVMSPNRLTTPVVVTKRNAGEVKLPTFRDCAIRYSPHGGTTFCRLPRRKLVQVVNTHLLLQLGYAGRHLLESVLSKQF